MQRAHAPRPVAAMQHLQRRHTTHGLEHKSMRDVPERLPHDLRRSAVRSPERSKTPRSIAMKMVGHKTDSMYGRYVIVDQEMLEIGKERLAQFIEDQEKRASKSHHVA